MPQELRREGGCLCRAVRYAVRGEPIRSGLCHCTTCRKLTGSIFSATATWNLDRVEISGELKTFGRRSFCPECGSRLFFLSETEAEVFLGTLDDAPNGIEPGVEVWAIRREPWLPDIPCAARHTRNEA